MTIDWWTLGLQAVNVVVLVWLLQRFFWRPVASMIEQRRLATAKALADAKAAQDKAAAAQADIDATRAGFAKEHGAILAAAHAEADKAGKSVLEAAAKEAASHAEAAHAATAAQHEADQAAWAGRSRDLAVQIAGRLAARLQGPAVSAAFLDWLVASIAAMPEADRRAAAADAGGFDATTPAPLPPSDQEAARRAIARAFGAEPAIAFRTDPALIAGIELHGPHFALDNSWRADLGAIARSIDGR